MPLLEGPADERLGLISLCDNYAGFLWITYSDPEYRIGKLKLKIGHSGFSTHSPFFFLCVGPVYLGGGERFGQLHHYPVPQIVI